MLLCWLPDMTLALQEVFNNLFSCGVQLPLMKKTRPFKESLVVDRLNSNTSLQLYQFITGHIQLM